MHDPVLLGIDDKEVATVQVGTGHVEISIVWVE